MLSLQFAIGLASTLLGLAGTAWAQWTDDARRCAQESDPDLGLQYCSRVIESGQRLAPATVASVFYNRAGHYLDKGDYDRAVQDLGEAIRLNPKYAIAFYNRGVVYAYKKDYDRAVQDFAEALRLNPTDVKAAYNLGNAYADKREYDRAIEAYDQAIRLNPNLAAAFYNRGNAYAQKRDHGRAIQDFSEAIRLNPTDASAFYNRGTAYLRKGDYQELDRAVGDFDRAIQLDPSHASAFNHRGMAYLKKGEYDQAIRDFDRAIQLEPISAASLYNRGISRFIQGQFAAAVPDLTKAVELDPGNAYRVIWLYLAQARAGQRGGETLASSASRFNLEQWPGPVVSMYLGRVSSEAVVQAPVDPDPNKQREQKCEVYFFVGEYLLIRGLRDEAARMFQAAVGTGALGAYEYHTAKAELRHMR